MTTDTPTLIQNNSILLFDGHCNLCSGVVQFILTKEKNNLLYFASLQSEAGAAILAHFHINPAEVDSLVLVEQGRSYIKSAAALRVARYLKGLYPWLFGFIIVPPFIRNMVYDYVARHRYKWYGRQESCMVPQPRWARRFL